ncbi:NF038122 family metalloprotease [Moorena producens]|uniref:NF038122 family metalloprotease n=1 Tax=Moorena producens TaxID=1155739 RepID=UPI003C795DE3
MKNHQLIISLSLASAAVIGGNAPAQAIDFDFSYQPGTSLEQMLGFEMAGQIWSYYLTDDITVKIHVEMTDSLPSNILGGALPGLQKNKNYGTFLQKLESDITSKDDEIAHNKLQDDKDDNDNIHYQAMFESGNGWNNTNIALTNANAKAIKYHSNNSLIDGYIVMNDTFNWSYDYQRNAPTPLDAVDFLSVGIHEIGHILGFVSGVDSTILADYDASDEMNLERLMRTTALDMYRYSELSEDEKKLELGYGANAYFSIDEGNKALAYFSEGKDLNMGDGGDGYQASHWDGHGNDLGIMKPALGWGERADISPLDLRAFDVIGWDLNPVVFGSDDHPSASNMTLNLNNLLNNAKNTLADKIAAYLNDPSINASSIDGYIANDNETAGSWLAEDRIQDVMDMYEWGYGGGSGGGSGGGGGGSGSPQVLGQLIEQEGFFSDFNWSTFNPDQGVAQVPDPGATSGLIGFGLFGIGGVLKGRRR